MMTSLWSSLIACPYPITSRGALGTRRRKRGKAQTAGVGRGKAVGSKSEDEDKDAGDAEQTPRVA